MYKLVKSSRATIRHIAQNKIASNLITKDISSDLSLATTEATTYYEQETAPYNRIYYVLDGELELIIDGETNQLQTGDACFRFYFYVCPSTEIPIVLVDMDNVLADFDQRILDQIAERHPDIAIAARQNFSISDDYPEHVDVIRAMSDEAGFFKSLPVVEGALEGWQHILDGNYLPRICSAPISTNPYSKVEKLGWLEEHLAPVFGSWVVDQAIITKHKEAYTGIALIDDRAELRNAYKATWQHIVFDRLYNQHSRQPRLYGWRDRNLLRLLNAAAIRSTQI